MPVYKHIGKKGIKYQIVYFVNGKRKKETIGKDRKFAEMMLQDRLKLIMEGKYLDKKKEGKIKFEVYANQYLNTHCKNNKSWEKSDKVNLKNLKRHLSSKHLFDICPSEIEKYKLIRIEEGMSKATVNRELACLKSLFNRAIEDRKVEENPVCKVKFFREENKRLVFLEEDEIHKFLDACPNYLEPIVVIAIYTGMRRGEILNLKWRDIDIKRELIHVLDTKNGEKKEIPMNDEVKRIFIKTPRHKGSDYIFYNSNGKPYKDIRSAFKKALKKSGVKKEDGFRFHDLRHTFASHLVMNGVDLNTVSKLLGHKSIQMTLRYANLSPKHKKRAVDILGKKLAKNKPQSAPNLPQKEIDEIEKQLGSLQHTENK